MLGYVIMFVVMFAIKCVTLTFVKNKESTVVTQKTAQLHITIS